MKIDIKLDIKDKRNFEAIDYLLINEKHEALKWFLEQNEYKNVTNYIEKHLLSLTALYMCIDNDSAKCLSLLLRHFDKLYDSVVLNGDYRLLMRRCLLLKAANCLKELLNLKSILITPIELELSIYEGEPESVNYLIKKYFEQNTVLKLPERVIKACIYAKKLEYLQNLLEKTSELCCENNNNKIEQIEIIDWPIVEIKQIYNLEFMKKKKKFGKINFESLYQDFNKNNILHYAVENEDEKIALLILKTNICLTTIRLEDKANCLILATKVFHLLFVNYKKARNA